MPFETKHGQSRCNSLSRKQAGWACRAGGCGELVTRGRNQARPGGLCRGCLFGFPATKEVIITTEKYKSLLPYGSSPLRLNQSRCRGLWQNLGKVEPRLNMTSSHHGQRTVPSAPITKYDVVATCGLCPQKILCACKNFHPARPHDFDCRQEIPTLLCVRRKFFVKCF